MDFFIRPSLLWLVPIVPMLALWVWRGRARRRAAWWALGRSGKPGGDGGWLWLGSISLMIVALAGPRWGRGPEPELPAGHDVVLVIDDSRSMAAQDAVPNRLGVAIEAAESLVRAVGREPGGRVGVVAFAGRGVTRCPLTPNLGAVIDVLHNLRPGDVRPGGTDLSSAIDEALDAFQDPEPAEGRTVIVFSDGEDLAGRLDEIVPRLRDSHVIVHSVAIGDAEHGHPIPLQGGGHLSFEGETVSTKRVDAGLERLARETDGAWLPLGLAATDLGSLYEQHIAPVAVSRREAARKPERVDRYAVFVLASVVLSLAALWPGRRRGMVLASVGLMLVVLPGAGRVSGSARDAVAEGDAAYARGDLTAALTAFERAIQLDPDAAVPRFNAGATLFQLGRYDEAASRYEQARTRAGAPLQAKIDYALGNTAVALGKYAEALGHYDDCIGSTVHGPVYDALRRDARINRSFAERMKPPPPTEPRSDEGDQPESQPNPREPLSNDQENPGAGGGGTTPPGGMTPPGNLGSNQTPEGSSRTGGGGGVGASDLTRETARSRLDAAIDRVREALDDRLHEAPPPPEEQTRDW